MCMKKEKEEKIKRRRRVHKTIVRTVRNFVNCYITHTENKLQKRIEFQKINYYRLRIM